MPPRRRGELVVTRRLSSYAPFALNLVEQATLTLNSLALNILIFALFETGSGILMQAITVAILVSVTSTLVNALSTWRILDHSEAGVAHVTIAELLAIAAICVAATAAVSLSTRAEVDVATLLALLLTSSAFYFLRDVLIYLRSIPVLIAVNLVTILPIAALYLQVGGDGAEQMGIWGVFQIAYLIPRLGVVFILGIMVVRVAGPASTLSLGAPSFSRKSFTRCIASLSVAGRQHAPYFILNALGLPLMAELFRRFFLTISPIAQVLQANYAFFLPRKESGHLLIPSLAMACVAGICGSFLLMLVFLQDGGGPGTYAYIAVLAVLMCLRALIFIRNRVRHDYGREIAASVAVVASAAVYASVLTQGLATHYVIYVFAVNELVYLASSLAMKGNRGKTP